MNPARSGLVAAMARHLITVCVGIVTIGVIARMFGADALGLWALLGTTSFLLGLADLGIPVAAQRALTGGHREEAVRATGLALATTSIGAPLLALIAASWLVPLAASTPGGDVAIWLGLGAGVVNAAGSPARGIAVVTAGAMRALAWSRGSAAIAQLLVTLAWLSVERSLAAPAAGLLASALVETALDWRIVAAFEPALARPKLPRARHELVTIARDASAALAINVAVASAVRLDVALIATAGTLATVGGYGIAARAVDQLFSLAKQVSAAALPGLRDVETRDAVVRIGVARLGGIAGSGLAALATCGGPLLVAWAGPAAGTALTRDTLAVLGFAAVIAAVTEIPAAALTLGGRSAWSAAGPIAAGATVNVAIGITCIGSVGPLAIAVATIAGNIVNATWTWRRAITLLGWDLRDVLRTLAPVGGGTLIAFLVGALLRPAATSASAAAVACAVSAVCGLASNLAISRRLSRITTADRWTAPTAIDP